MKKTKTPVNKENSVIIDLTQLLVNRRWMILQRGLQKLQQEFKTEIDINKLEFKETEIEIGKLGLQIIQHE